MYVCIFCAYVLHIPAYSFHIYAYFLPDPFQLAWLLAIPVPFQQALQQQVCMHSLLLASSCWFTRPTCPPHLAAVPSSSATFLLLLLQDKIAILAEYIYISYIYMHICNTCWICTYAQPGSVNQKFAVKNLMFFVWPPFSTWKISKWRSCTWKIRIPV